MRTFRTEGIIIKRRNFGEADRILTVLTKEFGKLHIKATGVRKITSRRSGHIELLNNSVLHLYKGNGFPVLTEVKMLDDFSPLKADLYKIGLAYHLCELVDGLCPENQEQRGVFELLKNTLQCLKEEENAASVIHHFERKILNLLGYLPAARQGWNNQETKSLTLHDAPAYIESIMERRLKSKRIFSKLQ